MSSVLKKLAGQTALYGLSSIIGRAVNFLLVPLLTHVLLPAEYGVITYLYAYAGFLNIIYLYGLETGYFRFAKKEQVGETKAFSVTFSSLLVTTAVFTVIITGLSQPIAELILEKHQQSYVILLALILATDSLAALPFARLRWEEKAATFAILKLVSIFLNIGFTLLFLKVIPEHVLAKDNIVYTYAETWLSNDIVSNVLWANLLGNLFPFVFLWKQLRGFYFSLQREVYKELIVYCMPLMLMGLAGMVDELMGRILLNELLPVGFYPGQTNMHALGVYGACYKLSMFMTLAIQSFRYAADPFFFSKASDKKAPELFARVMTWFVISCLSIFILVSVFIPYFGQLLRNPLFREGLYIVPFLLLANLFLGVYYNLSMWYKLTDKTIYGTYLSLIGAAITILGNIALIPFLGYFGSALTTLICYFGMTLISWYYGQKYYPVPYRIGKIGAYIAFACVLIGLSWILPVHSTIWLDVLYRSGIFLLYPLTIYLIEIRKISGKLS